MEIIESKEFAAKEKLEIVQSERVTSPPEADRCGGRKGVWGGNSARPTNFGRNQFEFFRTHTASMNYKQFFAIIGVFLIAGIFGYFIVRNFNNQANISYNDENTDMKKPTKEYSAILHTEKGDITISLNAKETPITVNNFVTLSKKGFYDNTIFHRVIKGFMIQGGDPKGDGTGGPGYKFDDEPFTGKYLKGTIAMANAGPNTNGSQFFIIHADYPLPKNYVIFGQVTKGLEVVDEIATAPVQPSITGELSSPVNPVKITSIDIKEK